MKENTYKAEREIAAREKEGLQSKLQHELTVLAGGREHQEG